MAKLNHANNEDLSEEREGEAAESTSEDNLQHQIGHLFESYNFDTKILEKTENMLADAVLTDLVMDPILYEKYRSLIEKHTSSGPMSSRYGLFNMLADAKASAIAGKLKVSCLRLLAAGETGTVIAMVPRKLVFKLGEHWERK
jgi:hypothetical protein